MTEPLRLMIDRLDTPIGEMVIVADYDGNLRAAEWTDHEERMHRFLRLHYGEKGYTVGPGKDPHGLIKKIKRYFAGDLAVLDKLPVATGGTSFQRSVWRALRAIRCGTTTTYAELAQKIGKPKAVRAVGLANGSNPISVIVPCHRVIGSNGSLTGYGGGLHRKQWLLEHESGKSLDTLPKASR
jgi:methylated-DNA-[protein]-cysteine S-methyltransferase